MFGGQVSQSQQETAQRWNEINVGDLERWACALGGGALVAYGLARHTWGGLLVAALGGSLVYRGFSGHCPMYGSLGISTAGQGRGPATSIPAGHGVKVEKAITVNRPPEQVYRWWRNLENLPRVMTHLQSVKNVGHRRSHWVVRGPLGKTVEWDAEIITEREPEVIGWRSLEGSEVDTAGSVHFTRAPGGRGTEVRVVLKYDPPGGKAAATVAWLFGAAPEQEIEADLRRFKQMMEAGEIATATGPSAPRFRM
jgi:uncharacterized membrane protein